MNSFTSLGLVAVSLGVGYFVGMPMYNDLGGLSTKKIEYQSALESLNSIQTIQKSLTQKLEALTPLEQEQIKTLIPNSPGSIKLIADISSVASKYGIAINGVTVTASVNDNGGSVADSAPRKSYQSEMINFSFISDYNKLRSFLTDLESSMRLIDIRSINVAAGDKGLNAYKISAEIYWLP